MPTVYVTAPPEAADDIARTLVEERLAACVNRVDCRSVYRWEGTVHDEVEVILLAKTTDEGYEALSTRIVELHPYDVPRVERFDEDGVLPAFDAWRGEVVGDDGEGSDGENSGDGEGDSDDGESGEGDAT